MRRKALLALSGVVAAAALGLWLLWPAPATSVTSGEQPSGNAAAAIDGEWLAEMQKPGEPPFKIRLTFALMGDQIMGSVRYPTGDGPILDGRYANGQMTFHTSHVPQFESQPAVVNFQARVEADVIRLTAAYAGGVATGVARRAGGTGR